MFRKRNLLTISLILICFGGSVSAQTIEDASRKTIGYISSSGTVENASRSTIGYINSNGTVENASRSTIGYINWFITETRAK